ncbi:MAG: Rrf2 family transcriptional regulator [Thermoguttaceae bacterium]|nr:Rrf2 family transcriptional regulator [Thermoguttaceae bacterium]
MISTRGRYALRVMIDLAEHRFQWIVPLKDIAERQEISKKYLELLVRDLVAAKLIVGISGRGGGYKLSRRPEEYTVGEILEVMEGSLSQVACLSGKKNDCPRNGFCKTLPMWKELDQLVHTYLFEKKLSDLVADSTGTSTQA